MKTSTIFMATLCAVATASNTRGARALQAQQDEIIDRLLVTLNSTQECPYSSAVVFFDVNTNIVPDATAPGCTSYENLQIGLLVNQKLVELGLQDMDPSSSSTSFVAGVCPTPLDSVSTSGFMWVGGGGCRFCQTNNGDGRRLILAVSLAPISSPTPISPTSPSPADLYFDSTVAPVIQYAVQTSLRDALKSKFPCTGVSPKVTVTVTRKNILTLATSGNLQCLGDSLSEMLLDGSI